MTINEQIEAIKKVDIEAKKEILKTLRMVKNSYSSKNGYSVIIEMSESRYFDYIGQNYDANGNLKGTEAKLIEAEKQIKELTEIIDKLENVI